MNSMVFDIPSVEGLMNSPLCTCIAFSANKCDLDEVLKI